MPHEIIARLLAALRPRPIEQVNLAETRAETMAVLQEARRIGRRAAMLIRVLERMNRVTSEIQDADRIARR